jgi:hypothetical protein
MTSYHIFDKLQQILAARELPEHGIRMGMSNFFFHQNIEHMTEQFDKMQEIASSEVHF